MIRHNNSQLEELIHWYGLHRPPTHWTKDCLQASAARGGYLNVLRWWTQFQGKSGPDPEFMGALIWNFAIVGGKYHVYKWIRRRQQCGSPTVEQYWSLKDRGKTKFVQHILVDYPKLMYSERPEKLALPTPVEPQPVRKFKMRKNGNTLGGLVPSDSKMRR